MNLRIEFLQAARVSYECSAGSQACHKVSYAAAGLLPNLVRGGLIMRPPIGGIAVLIGIKIFVRLGRNDLPRAEDGAVGPLVPRS